MYRQLAPILMQRHRANMIERGSKGLVPEGINKCIMTRVHPWANADWDNVKQNFVRMRVRMQAEYLPSNRYYATPLFVISIVPLDPHLMPVWGKPNSETPLHVSIAFYDPAQKRTFDAIHNRYLKPREVELLGYIEGSTFRLEGGPIADDLDIQHLHANDYEYGHKALHVSM